MQNSLFDEIPEDAKIWAAAAIEYEGCIIIRIDRRHRSYLGSSYSARVRIYNTRKELLDLSQLRIFGGRLYVERTNDPKSKPCWTLTFDSKQLIRLLKAVRPYLITKQEQADIALKLAERQQLTRVQTPEYKKMYQRMQELNRRGK